MVVPTRTRDMQSKEWWLDLAEVIDAYRLFPRVFLSLSFMAFFWLLFKTWEWYTAIDFDAADWTNLSVVTAFPVTLITAVSTMFYKLFDKYSTTGRDWSKRTEGDALPKE